MFEEGLYNMHTDGLCMCPFRMRASELWVVQDEPERKAGEFIDERKERIQRLNRLVCKKSAHCR